MKAKEKSINVHISGELLKGIKRSAKKENFGEHELREYSRQLIKRQLKK